MRNDVSAELDRAAMDGGGEGIVDDHRHAVGVCPGGEALDVEHLHAGIGDGLGEDELGIGLERSVDLLVGSVVVNESHVDTHLAESHAKEVEGAPVDIVGGDHVVTGLADIEACEEIGGLPGGGQHRAHSTFEGGYLGCNLVIGGILESGIEITGFLEVEKAAHLVAGFVFERGTLYDGDLTGFSLPGGISGLDTKRPDMRLVTHFP